MWYFSYKRKFPRLIFILFGDLQANQIRLEIRVTRKFTRNVRLYELRVFQNPVRIPFFVRPKRGMVSMNHEFSVKGLLKNAVKNMTRSLWSFTLFQLLQSLTFH